MPEMAFLLFLAAGLTWLMWPKPRLVTLPAVTAEWDAYMAQRAEEKAAKGDYT